LTKAASGEPHDADLPQREILRSGWALVPIGYLAIFSLLFAPALLGGRLLAPGDGLAYYLPAWSRIQNIPPSAWEPRLFSGYPIFGDPQAMAWYPVAWLDIGWNGFVLAAYVLASSFTHGYVRSLTRSNLAAAASGLIFGGSGFLVAHLGHTAMVHGAAWLPLVVWSLHELRGSASLRWVVAGAFGVACTVVAGHPQIAAWGLSWCGAFALFCAFSERHTRTAYLVRVAACFAIGITLSAIVVLPAAEVASQSIRGAMSYDSFSGMSMRFDLLPRLVLPWVYGGWYDGAGRGLAYFGRTEISEVTGFVGILPLALAMLARSDARHRAVRFWAAAAPLALLFSLGRYLHAFAPLYLVPIYNKFRVPPRHLLLFSLAIAVLAGCGLARIEASSAEARLRGGRFVSFVVPSLFAVAVLWVTLQLASGYWDKSLTSTGIDIASALPWRNPMVGLQAGVALFGVLCVRRYCRAPTPGSIVCLVAAIGLDLASFAGFAEWRGGPPREALAFPASLASLRETLARTHQRLVPLTRQGPGPGFTVPPNQNLLWDLPIAAGLNPLALSRYSEFLGTDSAGFKSYGAFAAENRSLDLLAARFAIAPTAWLATATPELRTALADTIRWQSAGGAPGVTLLENVRARPRAWLVSELVVAAPAEIQRSVETGRLPDGRPFDPSRVALVEESVPGSAACASACGTVAILELGDDRMKLRVEASEAAFLVTSDSYFDGWRATVAGRTTPIVRTDACLRGVRVPAGIYEVSFEFRPRSRVIGAIASATGLAASLGLLLVARRR
jgi:hypothetical protein